jgi:LacI family transcriptional regulator
MSVSRALRDQPGVSEETRARIKALAVQYHYYPNHSAYGQFTGCSRLLGCIVPHMTSPYYARMLRGVMAQAQANGYAIVSLESGEERSAVQSALHTLLEHRVDAVIMACPQTPLPKKVAVALRSHNIACVYLNATPEGLPMDVVLLDEDQLAQTAVQYLYRLDHRRISYFGDAQPSGRRGRYTALQHAFRQHGLSWHYQVPLAGAGSQFSSGNKTAITEFHRHIQHTARSLMQMTAPPTAIIVSDEETAVIVHQTVKALGLAIPQQLSLLSYVDFNQAPFLCPPVTAMELHPEEIGRQGVLCALARWQAYADDASVPPAQIKISGEIIARGSCAPAPR